MSLADSIPHLSKAEAHRPWPRVVVDEVYKDVTNDPTPPAAARGDVFATTSSLTKSYGLSSLRAGWVIAAPALTYRVRRVRDVVDGTGSIGPWLVPFVEESQIGDIRLTTKVNGEVRQDDRTSRMTYPFRYLINYISTFTTLVPGDIIVTGTPTGAGARFDPPIWLKPGDVVEVEAEGIGVLRNGVADEVAR